MYFEGLLSLGDPINSYKIPLTLTTSSRKLMKLIYSLLVCLNKDPRKTRTLVDILEVTRR